MIMSSLKQLLAIVFVQFVLSTEAQDVGAGGTHPLLSDILERLGASGKITPEVLNQIFDGSSSNGSAIETLVLQLILKTEAQGEMMQNMQNGLNEMKLQLSGGSSSEMQKQEDSEITPGRPRDCYDILRMGTTTSGVYTIYPDCPLYRDRGVRVWCDMDEGEGGWTVILLRKQLDKKQVNFNQGWTSYRRGFGDPNTEYWIGNDILRRLTSRKAQQLRVDMTNWSGESKYAEYDRFYVSGRDDEYRLGLGGYYGTAGDALRKHNNMRFSTVDRDNDINSGNCADSYGDGGFWYHNCQDANPTGRYYVNTTTSSGINWYTFNDDRTSMMTMTMKLKPASCFMD